MPDNKDTGNKLLGIFGGTFDPIHMGHLKALQAVNTAIPFEQTLLLPCHIPPHKASPKISAEHRKNMLHALVAAYPWLTLDSRELQSDKPSYTYHTLLHLKREYPQHHLCFIIGMDSMQAFDTWYEWQKILELCHLIVMKRGGFDTRFNHTIGPLVSERKAEHHESLLDHRAGRILFCDTPKTTLSSSVIREQIKESQSIDGLIPKEVIHYIHQHGLYL